MIEPPQIVNEPPTSVDPEEWARLNQGQRLRWLKAHQYELHLSRDQFLQLSRVPFWAMYGPEHGLPNELFNDRGFLLPKYRPGGGLHDEFQRWRRAYRLASFRQLRIHRRLQRFWRGRGAFVGVIWLMAGVFLGKALARSLQPRFPGVPTIVLEWTIVVVHCLVGGVLVLLLLWAVSRCIARRALEVTGIPAGDRSPSGRGEASE
jgi:hypothetical protein